MKRLSDETFELLNRVNSSQSFVEWLKTRRDNRARLIDEVAERQEPWAIPHLITALFDRSTEVAFSASEAIHRLISIMPVEQLIDLDEHIRWASTWAICEKWKRLSPTIVATLPQSTESRSSVIGIASFHPNGFVREEAVRQLTQIDNGSELPFLLIRLNDWVDNVRAVAMRAVAERLQSEVFEPFVQNLYLVLRLADCGRSDHTDLINSVLHRLAGSGNRNLLLRVLESPNRLVRRKCFQMIINLVEIDHWWHIEHGLRSSDPLLRLWSARKVPLVLKGESLSQAVVLMKSDSFMPVRREALRTCVAVHADDAERTLEEALLDRSYAIRDEARFHLKKLGNADFASVYRNEIKSDKSLVAAISGLGETGTKADAELVLPYTSSSFPIQRRVSVRAIGKLSAEDHIGVLIGCLTDDSPKVTSEARKMLQDQIHHIDPELMWNICMEDDRIHVKLAALELLNEFSVWRSLPYFLQAAVEMEHRMSDRASVYIQMAVNRVFTKPSETERRHIQDTLDRYKAVLNGSLLKELRPWLRMVGGFDV